MLCSSFTFTFGQIKEKKQRNKVSNESHCNILSLKYYSYFSDSFKYYTNHIKRWTLASKHIIQEYCYLTLHNKLTRWSFPLCCWSLLSKLVDGWNIDKGDNLLLSESSVHFTSHKSKRTVSLNSNVSVSNEGMHVCLVKLSWLFFEPLFHYTFHFFVAFL